MVTWPLNTFINMLLLQFPILCKWAKSTCPSEGWHCSRFFSSCITSPFHVTSGPIISVKSRRMPVTFTLFYLYSLFIDTVYYLPSGQMGAGRWTPYSEERVGNALCHFQWIAVYAPLLESVSSFCVVLYFFCLNLENVFIPLTFLFLFPSICFHTMYRISNVRTKFLY